MGKKSEQIRKSKDDCYPIPGRIAIKYRISTAPSSEDGSRLVTIFYDEDGHIDEDKTYADWWLKEKKLGKYANDNSSSKESEKVDKSASSGGTESFWIKLLFTIIPLLPIWWLIKLPFKFVIVKLKSIINAIFCGCCSDGGDSEWPAYSFIKF